MLNKIFNKHISYYSFLVNSNNFIIRFICICCTPVMAVGHIIVRKIHVKEIIKIKLLCLNCAKSSWLLSWFTLWVYMFMCLLREQNIGKTSIYSFNQNVKGPAKEVNLRTGRYRCHKSLACSRSVRRAKTSTGFTCRDAEFFASSTITFDDYSFGKIRKTFQFIHDYFLKVDRRYTRW